MSRARFIFYSFDYAMQKLPAKSNPDSLVDRNLSPRIVEQFRFPRTLMKTWATIFHRLPLK
jgi:hypothetical protein